MPAYYASVDQPVCYPGGSVMSMVKDAFSTAAAIALIMFAIIGTFYSTMDRPLSGGVLVSLSDER